MAAMAVFGRSFWVQFCSILLLLMAAGCVVPPSPPGPTPKPDVIITNRGGIARASVVDFSQKLAATCDEAIAKLGTEIKTAQELNRFMAEANSQREYDAFTPIHQVWQDDFGGPRWSVEKAKESLKAAAEGFRAVK